MRLSEGRRPPDCRTAEGGGESCEGAAPPARCSTGHTHTHTHRTGQVISEMQ